jgi:F0F1-type ATP synthase membrane subunit b/b'
LIYLERDVSALLDQLGLDKTFFLELTMIAVLFFVLAPLYFKPFLKLFESRHKKTVEDREAAERLMAQANAKLEEYKRVLAEERIAAKKNLDAALVEIRKQEAEILMHAREEAKKITQEASDSVNRQRDQLRKQLENDIENISRSISEQLLSRKV